MSWITYWFVAFCFSFLLESSEYFTGLMLLWHLFLSGPPSLCAELWAVHKIASSSAVWPLPSRPWAAWKAKHCAGTEASGSQSSQNRWDHNKPQISPNIHCLDFVIQRGPHEKQKLMTVPCMVWYSQGSGTPEGLEKQAKSCSERHVLSIKTTQDCRRKKFLTRAHHNTKFCNTQESIHYK